MATREEIGATYCSAVASWMLPKGSDALEIPQTSTITPEPHWERKASSEPGDEPSSCTNRTEVGATKGVALQLVCVQSLLHTEDISEKRSLQQLRPRVGFTNACFFPYSIYSVCHLAMGINQLQSPSRPGQPQDPGVRRSGCFDYITGKDVQRL